MRVLPDAGGQMNLVFRQPEGLLCIPACSPPRSSEHIQRRDLRGREYKLGGKPILPHPPEQAAKIQRAVRSPREAGIASPGPFPVILNRQRIEIAILHVAPFT